MERREQRGDGGNRALSLCQSLRFITLFIIYWQAGWDQSRIQSQIAHNL